MSSSVSEAGRPTRRRRTTRTRTGCLTCRARKIKCDEGPVVCRNCARADLECVWPGGGGGGAESLPQSARAELVVGSQGSRQRWLTQAGLRRRRVMRSCAACKLAKKRCGGERPRCGRCLDRGLGCRYEEEEPGPELERRTPPGAETVSPVDSVLSPPSLMDTALVRDLCDAFFEEIAPLRCFGFLHRHSFLQDIVEKQQPVAHDDDDDDDALLLSVCALATKSIRQRHLWEAGCGWARRAQGLVFAAVDDISVRRLMCVVLLYEHAARAGEQRLCFMLSAMAARYTQALSLNLESDGDVLCLGGGSRLLSPVERESRRRLMWACYILDSMQASGVGYLQVIDASTIRIQLPCDERHFLYKVACRTATVPLAWFASSSGAAATAAAAAAPENTGEDGEGTRIPDENENENQDLDAFSVRLYLIRERVLQYINSRWDEEDPWRLTFPLADLERWKESLPPELRLNSDVITVRRGQASLSALVSLHVLYHQVHCLLNRCTIPSMLFPARARTGLSEHASPGFLAESRRGWFDHACAMSTIFEVALQHRPASMADPGVAISAYNAIIIKWLYLTNFVSPDDRIREMDHVVLPLVRTDLEFLRRLHGYHPCVRTTYAAARRLVDEAAARVAQDPTAALSETAGPPLVRAAGGGYPPASATAADRISPERRTNPLSTFAQMRKTLPDVHAVDRRRVDSGSPGGEDHQLPGTDEGLWMWR